MVSGTAADVTFEAFANVLLARVRVLFDKFNGAHHHAGCAETALQAMVLVKRLLHRMQRFRASDPFDGRDLCPFGGYGQHGAGFYGFAVHMDDTGATLAGVATDMSACQRHGFADEADEERIVGHIGTDSFPVQREIHVGHHFLQILACMAANCFAFLKHALEYRYANQKLCK